LAVEGLLYGAFPEQMQRLMRRVSAQPASSVRTFGLTALAIGLAIVWLGSR
jgi:uncharacterized protein YjeT (DUF2065 family)